MNKHIFSENAPQFFGSDEGFFTADEVTEMRRSFKAQKITVDDLKPAMGENANKCLSFDYDVDNWLNCAQWSVRDFDIVDDYVILDFIGTAG